MSIRSRIVSFISKRPKTTAAVTAIGATAANAAAAPTATMPPVDFPLDLTSVGTQIGTAGASMIGIWAGLFVAFKLTKGLVRSLSGAVR